MATPQSALQASFADHRHPADETCPYCEQPIPNDRAEEIRARHTFKQKQDEDAANARADKRIADARAEMEAAKIAEHEKWRAEAFADKNAALEQTKKEEREAAQLKIKALTAEREAAAIKIAEADQKRQEAVDQLEAEKAKTEEVASARAAEVRVALEKDTVEKDKKKDADHAAAIQKVSDELVAVQRKLASLEGEGEGDDIVFLDELKKAFPGDQFEPLTKNDGADIIHTVKHGKKVCGKIVYDCSNRKIWQDKFANLLHNDMVSAGAMHAILATTKFPKKGQQVCKAQGVILVHPGRVVVIADILREEVIRNFAQRVSDEDRSKKTAKLYDFITSEQFGNVLESLDGNVDQLMKIEEEDRKRHKRATESREKLYLAQRRLHAKLQMDIDRIVGTGEAE